MENKQKRDKDASSNRDTYPTGNKIIIDLQKEIDEDKELLEMFNDNVKRSNQSKLLLYLL
jgi:hypothetical protein